MCKPNSSTIRVITRSTPPSRYAIYVDQIRLPASEEVATDRVYSPPGPYLNKASPAWRSSECATLSPCQTCHIKRVDNYKLDLSQIAAPPTDDLAFELKSVQEFPEG